jgi:hypothetical protein
MFCTDETSFGKYQKFIEDACAKTKKCVVEDVTKAFDQLKGTLHELL